MIRSAMAAMIAAALEAAPAYAQTQGQPQTPSPNYPYQEVKRPPAGEVIRDVVQDAVDAAAARAREERRRERERRERERLEWERQQAQIPPTYPEPPVAVAQPLPEPSSPPDPELNREPVPAPAQPTPTRRATQKPAAAIALGASQPAKPAPPETAPPPEAAPRPAVDPGPTVTAIGDPPLAPPAAEVPPPPQPESKTCPDGAVVAVSAACPAKPLSRWWPLALLGLGVAAAGGGWSVQQRRARLARTRAALSLEPRLDQQAGTSATSPIKLAAPRVSIRTRLEYS